MAEVVIKGMTLHKIVVKGNCTACGKPLGENDGLFLCAECQKKNNEHIQRGCDLMEE